MPRLASYFLRILPLMEAKSGWLLCASQGSTLLAGMGSGPGAGTLCPFF